MNATKIPEDSYENGQCILIPFEIGCRCCSHLERVGKNTYICAERIHMDDSPVIPIKDGLKTDDWNICNGEYYNKSNSHTAHHKTGR